MKRRHIPTQEAWDIYNYGKSSNYTKVITQDKDANIYGYGASELIVKDRDKNLFAIIVNKGVYFGEVTSIPTDSYKGIDDLVTLYPVKKHVKRITFYE